MSKIDSRLYNYINHCCEKLRMFMTDAEHENNLTFDIIEILENEINSLNIIKDVTIHILMNILKKYKLTSQYENIPEIYYLMTKKRLPTLTKEEYDLLLNMCRESMMVYIKKFRPSDRACLLNHTFVLRKILYLINRQDIAEHFDIIHNDDKRQFNEMMWKKICLHVGWKYRQTD